MPAFDIQFRPGEPVCTLTFVDAKTAPISEDHPHKIASSRSDLAELSAQIRRATPEIEELDFHFDLLKADALSILHIKSAFLPATFNNIPLHMTDPSGDPSWFSFANSISALANCFGFKMVSYASENSGHLFVHLVAQLGHDEGALKSLKALRGHTDGMIFPMGGGSSNDPELPKGPDAVILGCINNPANVATTVAPLSAIIRQLSRQDVDQLQRNVYEFHPQSSFSLPGVVRTHQAVLCRSEEDGFLIRYSHSKVKTMTAEAAPKQALDNLGKAIANSLREIILAPGDIAFINNRTAIHGRTLVGLQDARNRRWLIRTYGQKEIDSDYCSDPTRPFELHKR